MLIYTLFLPHASTQTTYSVTIYIAFVIVVKHMLARCIPGTFYIHSGSIIIWKPDNHTTNVMVVGDTYIVRKWRLLTRIRSLGTVTIILGFIIVRRCTNSHISSYTCVTHVSVTRLLSYQGVIAKNSMYIFFPFNSRPGISPDIGVLYRLPVVSVTQKFHHFSYKSKYIL